MILPLYGKGFHEGEQIQPDMGFRLSTPVHVYALACRGLLG
jgi:hypothetical protein